MSKLYPTLTTFQKDYQYDLSDKDSFLGEGSYGIVVEAYDHDNNKKVALKIGKDLMQEFEAAKPLSHRNIAKYEACYSITDSSVGLKDYAIMQLYPEGNLSELLKNVKLNDKQLKDITRGILEGLQYLHSQNRIHRDFKPSNILVTKLPNGSYRPLIADFGLTKIVGENDYVEGSDVELSDGRGTASYKAPEQIEGEKAHYNLDLWAFGVILYEIVTGERPFKRGDKGTEQSRMNVLFDQIKAVQITDRINTIQEPYQSIIRRCLVKDIHNRVRKEDELLDLLDVVPKISENITPPIPLTLEDEANSFFDLGEFDLAMAKYAEILTKDNKNKVAQKGIKACMAEIEKLGVEEEKTDNKFEADEKESKVFPQTLNNPVLKVEENAAIDSKSTSVSNGKNFAKTTTISSQNDSSKSTLINSVNNNSSDSMRPLIVAFAVVVVAFFAYFIINKNNDSSEEYTADSTVAMVDTLAAFATPDTIDTIHPEISGYFTDPRDNEKYPLSKVDDKTWIMADMNYNVNGSIKGQNAKGRLYTFKQAQKACPQGSHVASPEEWESVVKASLNESLYTELPYVLNLNFSKNGWVFEDETHHLFSNEKITFSDVNVEDHFWTSRYKYSLTFREDDNKRDATQIIFSNEYNEMNHFACRCIKN